MSNYLSVVHLWLEFFILLRCFSDYNSCFLVPMKTNFDYDSVVCAQFYGKY